MADNLTMEEEEAHVMETEYTKATLEKYTKGSYSKEELERKQNKLNLFKNKEKRRKVCQTILFNA